MKSGLVLDSLTVEGLRGFNDAKTIDFRGLHTFIFGKMGTGKSSTLCAIEWALFGDIAHIKCSESRTQAEFVNANKIDQKARVTLGFKGGDGEYVVQREKHAKTRGSYLTLSTPIGKFEGDDAAKEIYSIFGTFDDFHRSVFLHQEAVRAILTENPEDRDLALDRLFGLERTRELMSAIPVTMVRKEYERLDTEKTKIEERIKGATQQAEIEMRRARQEASDLGLRRSDLNLQKCIDKCEGVIKGISGAAGDCGVRTPSLLKPSNEEDLIEVLNKTKEVIKSCRMRIAATSKINELQKNLKQIKEPNDKLQEALEELEEAGTEYQDMEKRWGTVGRMEQEEERLKKRDKELGDKRKTIDSTYRLVVDGIEVLSAQQLEKCPICDAAISSKDVLSKLRKGVSVALKESLSKLDSEREEISDKLLQLSKNRKLISGAIRDVKSAEEIVIKAEASLRKTLKSKSTKSKVLLTEAERKQSELQKELQRAERALSEKNEMLQGIDDSVDTCKAIVRVLDKEAEYERVRETFAAEDSQIQVLKAEITELSALHSRLQRISESVATAQINLAREFIGKGKEKISNYYRELCGHPYYNSILIDTDQRNVRGVQKNTYNIKAFNNKEGRETMVSTRFSTGQMNCAALSVFLSLSSMLDRRIKFMILDDPSQSLDREHKKSLVNVLGDVSKGSQVIVATQDNELNEEVQAGFMPDGGYNLLKYEGWGKEGPAIKVSHK
jgi:DNA repair exonuclease SbcCD ATPase subunit